MLYAGVDTHKKYSRVVVTNSRGHMVAQASLSNDIASFKQFLLQMNEPVKAVVEAGRTWGIIYDMLEDLGAEPVLANPLKARAIAEAKIKTDSIDARTLADLLRADLIPTVHVPSREARAQKNLLRQRFWLVSIRTMVKNRVHHILMGSVPNVVEKGIGISYPIGKPNKNKGGYTRWRKDTTRDRN